MKRAAQPPEAPALFDLPLVAEEPKRPAARRPKPRPTKAEAPRPLPLFPDGPEEAASEEEHLPASASVGAAGAASEPDAEAGAPADQTLASRRLRAGLLDLAALAAVLVILVGGVWTMDVTPRLAYWPAAAVFLFVFSFLYHSLPLAFWGQTPAMAVMGLVARAEDDEPLTFAQTALRWLGSTLTVLGAGLPLLLLLTGRSLGDRLSGSVTRTR